MTESLYSICSKKTLFSVSFAINLALKLKYHDLKRMKTILFKQLSHLEKQKTFWAKMLPIIIRKIKPFTLFVASLGSRSYFVSYLELDSSRRKPRTRFISYVFPQRTFGNV